MPFNSDITFPCMTNLIYNGQPGLREIRKMKRIIKLIVLCLAALCLLSSCGEFYEEPLEGTWRYDYKRGMFYGTLRVVFSSGELQITDTLYRNSDRTLEYKESTSVIMPYTIGDDGSVTATSEIGVMYKVNVSESFSHGNNPETLIWTRGNTDESFELTKESADTAFKPAFRGYEEYSGGHVKYYDYGIEVTLDTTTLKLFFDGGFCWEGDGNTVSSGSWDIIKGEKDKLILHDNSRFTLTSIELEKNDQKLIETSIDGSIFDYPDYWLEEAFSYYWSCTMDGQYYK